MKILAIDDNTDITNLLERILKAKGHEFSSCSGGKEGLSEIKTNNYDLIFLDLAMPEFDGEDVIDALNKDGAIKDLNIMLFTASSLTTEKIEEIVAKGAKGVLNKPVRMKELLSTVKRFEK